MCEYNTESLKKQAKMCNFRKLNAKLAGEEGSTVFLWSFIKSKSEDQEFVVDGVITDLVEHGFEVLVLQTGSTVRCYLGDMPIIKWEAKIQQGVKTMLLNWAADGKVSTALVCFSCKQLTYLSAALDYKVLFRRLEK